MERRCSELKLCFIVCQISTNVIPPIPVTHHRQSASTIPDHITATVYRASTVPLAEHRAMVATHLCHVVSYLSDHSKSIVGGRAVYTQFQQHFRMLTVSFTCHQNCTLIRKRNAFACSLFMLLCVRLRKWLMTRPASAYGFSVYSA